MVKYIGNAPTAVPLTSADITDGIISNSKLAQDIISADTEETSIATDDTILIHDTSASALRKMTKQTLYLVLVELIHRLLLQVDQVHLKQYHQVLM